jgi:hypothetical protein
MGIGCQMILKPDLNLWPGITVKNFWAGVCTHYQKKTNQSEHCIKKIHCSDWTIFLDDEYKNYTWQFYEVKWTTYLNVFLSFDDETHLYKMIVNTIIVCHFKLMDEHDWEWTHFFLLLIALVEIITICHNNLAGKQGWQLIFFLRFIHYHMNMVTTASFPWSTYWQVCQIVWIWSKL